MSWDSVLTIMLFCTCFYYISLHHSKTVSVLLFSSAANHAMHPGKMALLLVHIYKRHPQSSVDWYPRSIPSIHTWSTVKTNTPSTSWLTVGRQSRNFLSMHMGLLALRRLLTDSWSSVDWVLIEYQSKRWSVPIDMLIGTNQDVNRGYQLRVSIDTRQLMPLVYVQKISFHL